MAKDIESKEFREYIAGITPLNLKRVVVTKRKTKIKSLAPEKLSNPPPDLSIPQVTSEESLTFARAGIKATDLRLLRRGSYPQQAELDLHGLRVEEAFQRLLNFIQHCQLQSYRCVRIIHGKGRRLEAQAVLKNKINQWLRQMPQILAFCSAKPQHGGTGAVYVLLKRNYAR